jgi:predicted ArsR family transcriptional regulator
LLDSSFQWNQDGQDELFSEIERKLNSSEFKRELDEQAQEIVSHVNDEMAGQSTNDIIKVLRTRLVRAGFEPNFRKLQEIAQAISERNLRN